MTSTLYVKPDCPYCAALRRELDAEGKSYDEIDVVARREVVPELLKLTRGRRVVPVLVEDGRILVAPRGGCEF